MIITYRPQNYELTNIMAVNLRLLNVLGGNGVMKMKISNEICRIILR